MPHVRRDRGAVHVRGPLELRHVHVAGPHVLLLDVLPRPVYVHAIGGHGGGARDAAAAATGATRCALAWATRRFWGARAVGAAVFLAAGGVLPCCKLQGRGARSLPLWRLKGYIGERLSQSGLMQLSRASPRQTAKQRVNKIELAACKGTSKLACCPCPGLRARPQLANHLRLRRFGSETVRAKHLNATNLGIGCPTSSIDGQAAHDGCPRVTHRYLPSREPQSNK